MKAGPRPLPSTSPASLHQARLHYWRSILDSIRELGDDTGTDARYWAQARPCLSSNVQGWARMNVLSQSVRMSMNRCPINNPADCPRCTSPDRILGRRRREFVDVIREGALRIDADQFIIVTADYADPVRVPDGKRIQRVLGGQEKRWQPAIEGPLWCAETWVGIRLVNSGNNPPSTAGTVDGPDTPSTRPASLASAGLPGLLGNSALVARVAQHRGGIGVVRTGYLLMLGGNTTVNIDRLRQLLANSGAANLTIDHQSALDEAWAAYNLAYARCQWAGLDQNGVALAYLERRHRQLRCFIKLGPGFNGQISSDRMRNIKHIDAPEIVLASCSNQMKKVWQLARARERLIRVGMAEDAITGIMAQIEKLLDSKIYRIAKADSDSGSDTRPGSIPDEGGADVANKMDELIASMKGLQALNEEQFEKVMAEIRKIRTNIDLDEPRPNADRKGPGKPQ